MIGHTHPRLLLIDSRAKVTIQFITALPSGRRSRDIVLSRSTIITIVCILLKRRVLPSLTINDTWCQKWLGVKSRQNIVARKTATNTNYRVPDPLRINGSNVADDWRRFREQYEYYDTRTVNTPKDTREYRWTCRMHMTHSNDK